MGNGGDGDVCYICATDELLSVEGACRIQKHGCFSSSNARCKRPRQGKCGCALRLSVQCVSFE